MRRNEKRRRHRRDDGNKNEMGPLQNDTKGGALVLVYFLCLNA